MRSLRFGAAAVVAGLLLGQPMVMPSDAAPTPPAAPFAGSFTSTDVGFAEGSTIGTSLQQRLNGMTSFVAGRSPLLRVDLDWWYVQDCRTCALRWDRLDAVVDAAAARGMRVLLMLGYAPPWANGGHASDKWFPTDDAAWSSIVEATVRRYAGKVVAYEVWNEPNNVGTFSGYATDPKVRYWQLVRIAEQAIHAHCTTCVVLAGASGHGSSDENESALWLDWAYTNGYRASFDAVAHHPYPAWNSGFGPARPECAHPRWNMFGPPGESPPCGELAKVHAVMVRHGDTAKKIWATEWGYPTSGATGVGLGTIRNYLVQGVAMWRSLPYAGPLFLYSYADACTTSTDPECSFGVVTTSFDAKEPVYSDLSAALRATGTLCAGGSVSPPDDLVPVASLAPGQCVGPRMAMTSLNGRHQLWLQEDGNLVLYRASTALARWATGTRDGVRLENRADGNLALIRADGTVAWSSGTAGGGPATLWLQDDGNLVLYRVSDGRAIWASNTME